MLGWRSRRRGIRLESRPRLGICSWGLVGGWGWGWGPGGCWGRAEVGGLEVRDSSSIKSEAGRWWRGFHDLDDGHSVGVLNLNFPFQAYGTADLSSEGC